MIQEFRGTVKSFVLGISLLFGGVYAGGQEPPQPAPAAAAATPEIATGFTRQVSDFTLPNGLHFIVLERHDAPIVSFHTYIRAGFANVPAGQSGLLRLLERLAWSGTESIGSLDWANEKKALDVLEETYDRLQAERNKGLNADEVKITSLGFDVQRAMDRAKSFAKAGEYQQVLTDKGATGIGVTASADAIQYVCTLPSNRTDLWFSMESQRLVRPVFRGFYTEREALAQQLRSATAESRVVELFSATGFLAHPYRNPSHGWIGDVDNLRPSDLRSFIDRYLVPGNMTIAIAGDITAADARRLADKYFVGAAWSARPIPAAIPTQEPVQNAPRMSIAYSATTPIVAVGYRRPNQYDRDDIVFDVIHGIVNGAKGWLEQGLMRSSSVVTALRVQAAFPGGRYPALFAIVAPIAPGRTLDQAVTGIQAVMDRLRDQPLDDAALARAKAHVRETAVMALGRNASAAALLAASAAEYGDWRQPLVELDRLDKITSTDIQRVAAKYFVAERRAVAYSGSDIVPAAPGSGK